MIPILLDYECLRFIWWILLGVLLTGFAIMDGFDMGVAFLHPFVARSDNERRVLLNVIGPVWEGNQVWLILGAGAIFAAFPQVYATAFSSFYIALMLVLFSLILRPVSFEFRQKCPPATRHYWDWTLFLSGLIPPLVFGVALGNQFLGVPFSLDPLMQSHYHGSFWELFHPFALLCGLVSLAMMMMHGGFFLLHKTTEQSIVDRTRCMVSGAFWIWILCFIGAGWMLMQVPGLTISSVMPHDGPSNPLLKTVSAQVGAWFGNYEQYPLLWAIPGLAVFSALISQCALYARQYLWAWICSSLTIAGTVSTAGVALFPFLMTSSIAPQQSLTIWDASSSALSLWLMLIAAIIFVPLILAYTSWIFYVLRGSINSKTIQDSQDHLY